MRYLLLLLLCYAPLHAQSAASPRDAMIGKPLYLRGLWGKDKLSFDAAGKPRTDVPQISFTLSGAEIKSFEERPDRLLVHGRRMGLEFDKSGEQRVPLKDLGRSKRAGDEALEFEIERPPNGDYAQALTAIFTADEADLVPLLPDYWMTYAKSSMVVPPEPPRKPDTPPRTAEERARTKAPSVIHKPEPEVDEVAYSLKYSGVSILSLRIDVTGKPQNIQVIRPLGLNLDEAAVAAAREYVFKPATLDGKPIPVYMYVEVEFDSQ